MRISDSTTAAMATSALRTAITAPRSPSAFPHDLLEISDAARQQIDQLQQGDQALRVAVTQSRKASRNAAQERVGAAKEYLKLLARMSPTGDHGAASEAARIAREIRSAAAEFKANIAGEENPNVNPEIAAFAGVAGDALKIANGLVESYLRKQTGQQKGDADLQKEIRSAITAVHEIVNNAMMPVHAGLHP